MTSESTLRLPSLDEVIEARSTTAGVGVRTPTLRLYHDGGREIYLKLENLQPIGSFKLRGAANAIAQAPQDALRQGVYTASAGNMAQGVAWVARERGLSARIFVPEHAPSTKIQAIERLGGAVVRVPFEEWWNILVDQGRDGETGVFIHPVCNRHVMAGNGVIGLEILDSVPDVDAVLIPYGGGGLLCGIASVLRARRPDCAVYGCEVETAAPLTAALASGTPTKVDYTRSFVDGIGGPCVLDAMWPLVRQIAPQSATVSLQEVECAIRLVAERQRVIAEGAGAASVAAALFRAIPARKVVCVVSGGNLNSAELCRILGS
jgi:threonine dehydratase